MLKLNILKLLYKRSPMDFYTKAENNTIIKSINNTSSGYYFEKEFTREEINTVWNEIKLHKKFAIIVIFLLFLLCLYEIIFPRFILFVNNTWYVNTVVMFALLAFVYSIITFIYTKIFEKRLKKHFGEFKKVKFIQSENIDIEYYKLFKFELAKVLIVLLCAIIASSFISPFKFTKKLLEEEDYKKAIRITTIGSRIFPIAQEWYSLRGYARFKTGDFQGAIKDYDKAYNLGADGFNIMNFDNKIYVKYYLADYDSALKDFDKEIKNASNDNERDQFLWDKAQFLYNIKKYEDALALYNELIIKAENDRIFLLKDRLYMERAEVYKKLGLNDLAKQDLENSDSLDNSLNINSNPIPEPVLIMEGETF